MNTEKYREELENKRDEWIDEEMVSNRILNAIEKDFEKAKEKEDEYLEEEIQSQCMEIRESLTSLYPEKLKEVREEIEDNYRAALNEEYDRYVEEKLEEFENEIKKQAKTGVSVAPGTPM